MKRTARYAWVSLFAALALGACGDNDDFDDDDGPVVVVPPGNGGGGDDGPLVQDDFGPVFDRAFAQAPFDEAIDVEPGDITATDPSAEPVDVVHE